MLQIVLNLPQQGSGQVDGEVDAGMFGRQDGHGEVVAQGVQAHKGVQVAAFWRRMGGVFVDGLVLVPQERQVELLPNPKGGLWSYNLTFR